MSTQNLKETSKMENISKVFTNEPAIEMTLVIDSQTIILHNLEENFDNLKTQVSDIVFQLLVNDYPKLINILYRMDVDEIAYQRAFNKIRLPLIADEIAKLMIDRAISKQASRLKYKQSQNNL